MKSDRSKDQSFLVLLVSEGLSVAFPPEVYLARHKAEREMIRWSEALEAVATTPAIAPFSGRREIGDYWVRLVDAEGTPSSTSALWVCTFWTTDGYPDPEALLVQGRARARDWVRQPLSGVLPPASWSSGEWSETATFIDKGEECTAEAHLAKIVT
jgi:hypothetical protein